MSSRFAFLVALIFTGLLSLSLDISAQDLPKKIRGYKLHKLGKNADELDLKVNFPDPKPKTISPTGITIEIDPELTSVPHTARIDMLMFRDFKVNGIDVDVAEINEQFELKKGRPAKLPRPAEIFVPSHRVVKAVWKEFTDSKEEWEITGTILVFGKFKKMGFSFKRVVPLPVKVKIANPVRSDK